MTVEEFLTWHDDNRRRWELVDGALRAMVIPTSAHSELAGNVAAVLGSQLHPPFRFGTEAGLVLPDRDEILYVADFLITRVPRSMGERLFPDPILVGEILAPGTEVYDRQTKLPDYMSLPSVREIVYLSSSAVEAEVWQAADDDWRHERYSGANAVLALTSVPVHFSLAEVYKGLRF